MARTTITMPKELSTKAHSLGVNISKVAANAVEDAVKELEYRGQPPSIHPDSTPEREAEECQL